jgi:putative transposase
MRSLRRIDIRGIFYFITVVAKNRRHILIEDIEIFWASWKGYPLQAWAIMPDHFHALIETKDTSISKLVHDFKIRYSIRYRFGHGSGQIWQNRFWDHMIRNQNDLNRHLDYIHFNPVKHGLVRDPFIYPHSSLTRFFEKGFYQRNWGQTEEIEIKGGFGE